MKVVAQRYTAHHDQLVRETECKSRHGIYNQNQRGYPRVVLDHVEHLREHFRYVNFKRFVRTFVFRCYDARQQVTQMFNCNNNHHHLQ